MTYNIHQPLSGRPFCGGASLFHVLSSSTQGLGAKWMQREDLQTSPSASLLPPATKETWVRLPRSTVPHVHSEWWNRDTAVLNGAVLGGLEVWRATNHQWGDDGSRNQWSGFIGRVSCVILSWLIYISVICSLGVIWIMVIKQMHFKPCWGSVDILQARLYMHSSGLGIHDYSTKGSREQVHSSEPGIVLLRLWKLAEFQTGMLKVEPLQDPVFGVAFRVSAVHALHLLKCSVPHWRGRPWKDWHLRSEVSRTSSLLQRMVIQSSTDEVTLQEDCCRTWAVFKKWIGC